MCKKKLRKIEKIFIEYIILENYNFVYSLFLYQKKVDEDEVDKYKG